MNAIIPLLHGGLWFQIVQIVLLCLIITTFVSHTVAAIIMMQFVASIGITLGQPSLVVLVSALSLSVACAMPMTSFPNTLILLTEDDFGKHQ